MLYIRIIRLLLSFAFVCSSYILSGVAFANEQSTLAPEHSTVVEETIVESSELSPTAKNTVTIEPVAEKATSSPEKQKTGEKPLLQIADEEKSAASEKSESDPAKTRQKASATADNTKNVSTAADTGNVTAATDNANNAGVAADLEVVDFLLAGNIEAREPQNVVEAFSKDNERGFAFARLHAKAPNEVTFVWYLNDKPVARCKQSIQASKKWRTYSSVKLRPGQWKVQLIEGEDKVLAEKSFIIE